MPNSEVMTFSGNCVVSEIIEKNCMISMPSSIFSSHCCQSLAGLYIMRQKCGTTIPINRIGPKNAVTDAESSDEVMMIKNLSCVRLTPKLCAYAVPREFPINGLMVLKAKNNENTTITESTKI